MKATDDEQLQRHLRGHTKTLEIDPLTWRTPLSDVQPYRVRDARIALATHTRGYYLMEGFGGYATYHLRSRMTFPSLQRREGRDWKTWMIADPLHWIAMGERVAELPPGHVLCAGLGLGLMVHHLVKRADITHITTVEIDPDVIELITPTLPPDPRITIITDDWESFIQHGRVGFGPFDSILWDLAVGGPNETFPAMLRGKITADEHLFGVPLFQFGLRNGKRTV